MPAIIRPGHEGDHLDYAAVVAHLEADHPHLLDDGREDQAEGRVGILVGWHNADHHNAGESLHDPVEPVGLAEIGERVGVARSTVDQWRQRGVLPEPRWTVGGRPAWAWADIASWAERTGRL